VAVPDAKTIRGEAEVEEAAQEQLEIHDSNAPEASEEQAEVSASPPLEPKPSPTPVASHNTIEPVIESHSTITPAPFPAVAP
jgi:hypothetical protein